MANRMSKNVDKNTGDYLDYIESLEDMFEERSWEISQIKYAVLIGEHILFKGIPGTAKSMLAKTFFNGITGAKVFDTQFTRFMDESYIFGPQLLEEFKKGNIVHNLEGSIVEADFAFLDEFFNASEELLVSTNEVLNERTFTRQSQKAKSNLISAIMTTNQERESEKELRAVYDRILFKSDVKELVEQGSRISMYSKFLNKKESTAPTFKFSSLKSLIKCFNDSEIKISEQLLVIYDSLLQSFEAETGKIISPRKKNKMLNILLASAFLSKRKEVEIDDLSELKYALVTGGDSKGLMYFETVLNKVERSLKDLKVFYKMKDLFKITMDKIGEVPSPEDIRTLIGLEQKCIKILGEERSLDVGSLVTEFRKEISVTLNEVKSKITDSTLFGE